jgi:hypothetical protein
MIMRLLVAVAIAAGVPGAHAQSRCDGECPPPRLGPPNIPHRTDPGNGPVYGITTILGGILVLGLWHQLFPPPPPPPPPPQSYPPNGVAPTQVQLPGIQSPGGGPGGTGPTVQALRSGCNLPPVGETRYDQNLVLDIPSTVSAQVVDDIAARHNMTREQTTFLRLTGRTLHVWRIDGGTPVAEMIRNVCTNPTDRVVAGVRDSTNYFYDELVRILAGGDASALGAM